MTEHAGNTRSALRAGALLAILAGSLALNLWNDDFPLGDHYDEPKKVYFIQHATQDFRHPILMLQLAKTASRLLDCASPDCVVRAGRAVSGVLGTLLVAFTFLLARRMLAPPWDLLSTAAIAATPLVVIHSHYLKEDIALTAMTMPALLLLLRLVEDPRRSRSVAFGIAAGLAASAHFKGLLLLVILASVPLVHTVDRRTWYRLSLTSLLWCVLVFSAVNAPMFFDPRTLLAGLLFDVQQVSGGHIVRITASSQWFTFHLRRSIVPGLTPPLAILSVSALVVALLRWRRLRACERILAVYVLVFYFAVELARSKPFPGFIRYVVPIGPILVLFGFRLLQELSTATGVRWRRVVFVSLGVLVFAVALTDSLFLDHHLARDTRRVLETRLTSLKAVGERAPGDRAIRSVLRFTPEELRGRGWDFAVATSFTYERFLLAESLGGQDPRVVEMTRHLRAFLRLPYEEIRPAWHTFAFSNPTIRIFDLRGVTPQPTASPQGGPGAPDPRGRWRAADARSSSSHHLRRGSR